MNELIAEFFYEGIRRIIPGLIILVLYCHKEATNIFHAHQDFFSPYLFSICILSIAWLIGFMVETLTFALVALPLKQFPTYCLSKFLLSIKDDPKLSAKTNKTPNLELDREIRRQIYLESAQQIMCRCLAIISFVSTLYHPEPFFNLPWKWYFGLISFLIFSLGWFWLKWAEHTRS